MNTQPLHPTPDPESRLTTAAGLVLLWAAAIYFASVSYGQPAPAPPAPPAVKPATLPALLPQADLARQLAAPAPGGSVRITPGVYSIPNTIVLSHPGIYDLTGVELRGSKGTLIWTQAPDIRLIGATFNSDYPATRPSGQNPKVNVHGVIVGSANVVLDRCTFRNIDYAISLFPGQRNLTILNPTFTDEVRGDALYCGGGDETLPRGDVLWIGGTVDSSNQEQNIRCSTPGFSGLTCIGVQFRNVNGKECLGFRKGHRALLIDCTFFGRYPTFLGEGIPQPLDNCGDITFSRCHFMDGPVDVRFCKDVRVLDCDFHADFIPVTTSSGGNVLVKGLRRPASAMPRAWATDTTGAGLVTDLGGHLLLDAAAKPAFSNHH